MPVRIDSSVDYRGVDRDAWGIIDQLRFPGSDEVRRELAKANDDFFSLLVAHDIALARTFLGWMGPEAEIIAVRSPELQEIKGETTTGLPLRWIGFDYFSIGEWSIVREGIIARPEVFKQFGSEKNEFGLFISARTLSRYAESYRRAADEGLVEPIQAPDNGRGITAIEIGILDV
jgi:hypothetical protein